MHEGGATGWARDGPSAATEAAGQGQGLGAAAAVGEGTGEAGQAGTLGSLGLMMDRSRAWVASIDLEEPEPGLECGDCGEEREGGVEVDSATLGEDGGDALT